MADASPVWQQLPMNATTNIKPGRVVAMDDVAGVDLGVCQANSASIPFGIAQEWTKNAPGTPYDDGFAAAAGQDILVYAPGARAPAALKANSPALSPGILVGPDNNGDLVEVTSGWAVGWLFVGGGANKQQVLQVFVHPMWLGTGSGS